MVMSNTTGRRSSAVSAKPPQSFCIYTLPRGENVRAIRFDGEVIGAVEDKGAGGMYRAAIYTTRGGKFVTEFSSLLTACTVNGQKPERDGKAEVFDTLDAACDWFRPGRLTTELMKQLGRWEPETIE
jgi:hypothetical protein